MAERFAAAAAAGYERVSVSPGEVLRAEADGTPAREVASRARDLGLGVIVDPLMNWYPDSTPSRSRFAAVSDVEALRVCAALEAVAVTAIASATSDVPLAQLPDHFAALCRRAADVGIRVQLEFMPFTVVPGVRAAWDIVRQVAAAGLVFDTWHFFRGDADYAGLREVPRDRIFCVQVADARAQPHGSLRDETKRRLLPGDGELDLAGAIRALSGALTWVGPEVMHPHLEGRPASEVAAIALARTQAVLAAATAGSA
jgi:sugar phosphate isomerase/epimerase